MASEKPKEVCEDADGRYEGLFVVETTTSRDATGERDVAMNSDPAFKKVNDNRRRINLARRYGYNLESGRLEDLGPVLSGV